MHLYSGAQSSAELQPYKSLIMTSSLTRYLQRETDLKNILQTGIEDSEFPRSHAVGIED